jgi:two-component system, OmpR family, sensor histidine kinase ArlS
MTIRNKLTVQFTVIVASILLVIFFGMYYFSSMLRKNEFVNRIENRALSNARLLLNVKTVDREVLSIIENNLSTSLVDLKLMILDTNNQIVYKFKEFDNNLPSYLSKQKLYLNSRFEFNNGEEDGVGILFISSSGKEYKVFLCATDTLGKDQLHKFKNILIIVFFLSVIIIALAGYIYSRRALKPISGVVSQVDKISASRLDLRVDTGKNRDEIAQLAETFNNMLQRLENAFKMQRSFVSNASHELRTPLTVLTGQIEVALMNKRTPEEYQVILSSLLEEIRFLNSLSNGLLSLAQSSIDASAMKTLPIRIDEILFDSKVIIQRRHPDYRVNLDFNDFPEDDQQLTINGNSNLLMAAFTNLIDNACKFSDNHCATIKIKYSDSRLYISITDSGIGIPGEDLKKVYETFYRAKNIKNIQGHGIGLSLTRNIVEMHQGTLNIISKENIGTVAEISFQTNLT